MKGSTFRRCSCPEGRHCPKLKERRHGTWGFDLRIATTDGVRTLRRLGFTTRATAQDALQLMNDLIRLAADDKRVEAKVGDFIFERTKRGGQLPPVDDVRRRLGLRGDPGDSETFGAAWATWLGGNRRARPSTLRSLTMIGEHWLLPVLRDVPLDRISGAQCAMVFERIWDFNDELAAAEREERRPVLGGDVRKRAKPVGVATQHRIFAALRAFLNYQLKVTHVIPFNPVYAVRLEPEQEYEAQAWSAAEARKFLDTAADDPLYLMFRIIILRGERRGEAVGFRWSGADLDAGYLSVERTVLQLGGTVIEGKPKTRASARKVWLDDDTIALLKEHRKAQLAMRLRAGQIWQDYDLVFCREDGSPWPPDYVYRQWRKLAVKAGVPVIRLHDGRHSAASLAHDAEVDAEIRQKTLGHADKRMTSHYTHPQAAAFRKAANTVARHVQEDRP